MRAPLFVLCFLLLVPASCMSMSPWRPQEPPWTAELLAGARRVRVTRADGSVLVLQGALIDADARTLSGLRVAPAPREEVRLPFDQVATLETSEVEVPRVLANLGIGAGVVVLVTIGLIFAFVASLG